MSTRFKLVFLISILILIAVVLWYSGALPFGTLTREEANFRLKSQAQQMFDAMIAEDYEAWADSTLPAALDATGGFAKWMEAMKTFSSTNKQLSVKIVSIKVGEPTSLVEGSEDSFGIVPYELEMTIKDSRTVRHAFVIGVSSDRGRTWKYIEGTNARFRIKQLIPNFPDAVKLPKI